MSGGGVSEQIRFASNTHLIELQQILSEAMTCWMSKWQLISSDASEIECTIENRIEGSSFLAADLGEGRIWLAIDNEILVRVLRSAVSEELLAVVAAEPLNRELCSFARKGIEAFGGAIADKLSVPLSAWRECSTSSLTSHSRSYYSFRCGGMLGYIDPRTFPIKSDIVVSPFPDVESLFKNTFFTFTLMLTDVRLDFMDLMSLTEGLVIDTGVTIGSLIKIYHGDSGHHFDCILGKCDNSYAVVLKSSLLEDEMMDQQPVSDLQLSNLNESKPGKNSLNINVALLQGVEVPLHVRVGSVTLSAARLFSLKVGDVLVLERNLDAPVDVLFKEHVIATGMLVGAGDHYGVEIMAVAALNDSKS